ncbi:MAG: DUF2937 family protein [Bacteroidota bacterium]
MKGIFGFFGLMGNLVDRLLCVAGAILLAQAPVYMAQYIDVLSGAKAESGIIYDELSALAKSYNLDLESYLDKLASNPDQMVRDNIAVQQSAVERHERYVEAFDAITNASIWTRPFRFMQHADPTISQAVVFEPGLPLTVEGGVYALVGVLLVMLILGLIRRIGRGMRKATKDDYAAGDMGQTVDASAPAGSVLHKIQHDQADTE